MIPASAVLLHDPVETAAAWTGTAAALERRGVRTAVPVVQDDDRPPYAVRYVARASLEIAAARPEAPLLLVAAGGAGPLLPQIAAAQRAAHRTVAGYVLLDALLPQQGTPTRAELVAAQVPGGLPDQDGGAARPGPGGLAVVRAGSGSGRAEAGIRPPDFFTEPLPLVQDWPDAPCGYLLTDARYAACARLAKLRGWPVGDAGAGDAEQVADALLALVDGL